MPKNSLEIRPFVSFITPVYNAEKYLTECIESVVGQSDLSWELILVDDGSTDNSGRICDEYALRDQRIHVIHKENTGQFDSRMKGIRSASGKYCSGLDADDYIEPNCVSKLSKATETSDYDIVTWNIKSVYEDGTITRYSKDRYGKLSRHEFMSYVINSTDHSFCNKLIKTDILQNSYYGDVPKSARNSEDYIMICPSICQANSILSIDEALYNYRQQNYSTSHLYTAQQALDYMNSYLCIIEIWKKYNMLLPEFKQAEEKNLFSSVGICLKQAYRNGEISKGGADRIREHPVFLKLKEYESTRNCTLDVVVFMKLFRRRMDSLLYLIYKRK